MYMCTCVHGEIGGLQRSPHLTLAFETRSLDEVGAHCLSRLASQLVIGICPMLELQRYHPATSDLLLPIGARDLNSTPHTWVASMSHIETPF